MKVIKDGTVASLLEKGLSYEEIASELRINLPDLLFQMPKELRNSRYYVLRRKNYESRKSQTRDSR